MTYCRGKNFFVLKCIFKKILFIYLRERVRENISRGRGAEGEADSSLSREPDSGLDPRTLGS